MDQDDSDPKLTNTGILCNECQTMKLNHNPTLVDNNAINIYSQKDAMRLGQQSLRMMCSVS